MKQKVQPKKTKEKAKAEMRSGIFEMIKDNDSKWGYNVKYFIIIPSLHVVRRQSWTRLIRTYG